MLETNNIEQGLQKLVVNSENLTSAETAKRMELPPEILELIQRKKRLVKFVKTTKCPTTKRQLNRLNKEISRKISHVKYGAHSDLFSCCGTGVQSDSDTDSAGKTAFFSLVMKPIPLDVTDVESDLKLQLESNGHTVLYVGRIISASTNNPTQLVRVHIKDKLSAKTLVNSGFKYLCMDLTVEPLHGQESMLIDFEYHRCSDGKYHLKSTCPKLEPKKENDAAIPDYMKVVRRLEEGGPTLAWNESASFIYMKFVPEDIDTKDLRKSLESDGYVIMYLDPNIVSQQLLLAVKGESEVKRLIEFGYDYRKHHFTFELPKENE